MSAFLKVIGWSLVGSIIGGTLMFVGLLVYYRLFETSSDASVQGFQTGSQILGALGGAVAGLALGAGIGIVRVYRVKTKERGDHAAS
jgi:formate hydrogenlyase subunit 3/multisubunit Na+/H+ antiporter MnhD subunit